MIAPVLHMCKSEGAFYSRGVKRLLWQNSWGVRALKAEIKSQFYENTSKPEIEETSKTKLPAIEPYGSF
jgi:hypothetical protein